MNPKSESRARPTAVGEAEDEVEGPAQWNRFLDKQFERALVMVPEDLPDRWERIAGLVPGKSAVEVREHYEALVHDVYEIDSGRVEVPDYVDESAEAVTASLGGWDSASQISFGSKPKQSETERKKGTPWSKEEHRLFLLGLKTFGKGDWRSISRNFVITRTPTQVASHAQKYFLRQSSGKKERKRSSIHDITSVETNPVPVPVEQTWVPPTGVQIQHSQATQQMTQSQHPHDQSGGLGYVNYGYQM